MHSCLRVVLPRIPHNWPALWLWLQESILGSSFPSLFILGTIIIHLCVFWGLCLLLLFSERLGFLSAWKVIEDTDVVGTKQPSSTPTTTTTTITPTPFSAATTTAPLNKLSRTPVILSAAFHALMSQFLITLPLLLLSTPLLYLRGVSIDLAVPTFTQHLTNIIICIFAEEMCYYHLHRLMHSVSGLWEIHRRHHVKYFVTGLDSLAVPCVEVVLLRFIPFLAGPLICGCHLSTLYVWTIISTLVMVLMYSKHHFPLLPSPRAHLFHQQHYGRETKPQQWTEGGTNFGTFGIMDRWYETDSLFAPHAEHHKVIWDLDPPAKLKIGTFSTENSSWEFSWHMFFCTAWFQSWKPCLLWAAQVYWKSVVTFKANTSAGIIGLLFLGYWLLIRDGEAWKGYPGAGPFCHAPNMWTFLWDTNAWSMGLYWVLSTIFLVVDGWFDAVGLVARHRVQYAPLNSPEGTPVQPLFHHIDWKMWLMSTHWVICNFLTTTFMFPLFMIVFGFPSVCSNPHSWPAWYVVVLQLGGNVVLADVWFFLSHRANHSRFLYPYIHKQHHMLRATVAVGGVACHPVENWMVNFPTLFLSAYMTGVSLYVWKLWCCIVTINVCLSHSGYVIPYFPMGADPHDYHHWYLKCEYGAGGMMDALFGTSFKHFKKRHLETKSAST
jgi:sterol desaturase/sphingolipid hydroxylase (fatty acid hydroxylase superfamily)